MNKTILALALSGAAIFSASSFATEGSAGGVINMTGAISDTTCTINGGKSANFSVPLAPISITQAGKTVGLIDVNAKTIHFTFSDCAQASTTNGTLHMLFSSDSTISSDGKYLVNTTDDEQGSGAKHVGFALVQEDGDLIPLNEPFDTKLTGKQGADAPEKLAIKVSYYKPDAVEAVAGPLASTVTYTVAYL